MSLRHARTDDVVIDELLLELSASVAMGEYGKSRRDALRADRQRKRVRRVFRLCLDWYRAETRDVLIAESQSLRFRLADGPDELASRALDRLVAQTAAEIRESLESTIVGLILSWLLGWLFEKAIQAFVRFLLSGESVAWRLEQEQHA